MRAGAPILHSVRSTSLILKVMDHPRPSNLAFSTRLVLPQRVRGPGRLSALTCTTSIKDITFVLRGGGKWIGEVLEVFAPRTCGSSTSSWSSVLRARAKTCATGGVERRRWMSALRCAGATDAGRGLLTRCPRTRPRSNLWVHRFLPMVNNRSSFVTSRMG